MRKEIAPELYNYNKVSWSWFHLHGDKVETEGDRFFLGGKYQDAFDVTAFNQRVFRSLNQV